MVPFVASLRDHGDRPALVSASGTTTYAELAGRVEEYGERLGATRRLVLLAGASDEQTVVAYLAALAGRHPVLVAPDRDDVLRDLVDAYDPDVVIRHGDLAERRPGTRHELHPDLALLMSTSGSTGSPRLVRLGAEGVQANAEAIATYLSIRPTDVAATTLPLHYCYGLSVLHSHLVRGAAVVLTSLSVVDPCFWELVRAHGVTSLAGVPHTFELLERAGFESIEAPSLRYLTQAGGRMPPARVRAWAELGQRRGFDLFVMYGQTEATARMAYLPPDLALDRPEAVGVAIPGGRFSLAPVEEGGDPGVGELVYEGPNVMLGYATTPADLARGRDVHALRTGDLARIAPDGLVEVVGRRARFAKVLGLRIDLDRVDRALADTGHRAVCAPGDDVLLVAVEHRGRPGAARAVQQVTREVVARTGLPRTAVRVVPVDELPRLPSGKPDLRAVAGLAEAAAREPRPVTAYDVAGTYGLVLGLPEVGPDDSFVSLGGDSLSYVEASVRLEELLGHLPDGWHLATVAELERQRRRHHRRGRTVETGVLVRALAIVAIVGTHANLFVLAGGAHLLLVAAGANLARFQLAAVPRAERCRRLLRGAARVAVPSVLWLAAVTALTGAYPWPTVLLVNHAVGPASWAEPQWHFWFIEALVAALLATAALLAVPGVDRLERRWPFALPVALALLLLATRFELVGLRGGDDIHRPEVVAWLVALGWAVARAVSVRQRLLVSALVVATVPGFCDDLAREGFIVTGALALIWLRQVRLPVVAARVAGTLAAASLWIYLTHWQVYPHLEHRFPPAALASALAVGVAAWWLVGRGQRVTQRWTQRWAQRWTQRRTTGLRRTATPSASTTGAAPSTSPTLTAVPTS